jgi:hypothetical protein
MNEAVRNQAQAYPHRAEELRTHADLIPDPESREALHRLANGYDRLADNLDRVVDRTQQIAPQDVGNYCITSTPHVVHSR